MPPGPALFRSQPVLNGLRRFLKSIVDFGGLTRLSRSRGVVSDA